MEILDEADESNDRRIFIHQHSYICRMIEKSHMQDAAAVITTADPHVRLKRPGHKECGGVPIRIGKLWDH